MFGSCQQSPTADYYVEKTHAAFDFVRGFENFLKQSKSHLIVECKRWYHLPLLSRIDHEGFWS